MAVTKIVLHSLTGYRPELDSLVEGWINAGIKYVGVVGVDASQIEDLIDEICVGDGSEPYFMLTASHQSDETLQDAITLAELINGDPYVGQIQVVEF